MTSRRASNPPITPIPEKLRSKMTLKIPVKPRPQAAVAVHARRPGPRPSAALAVVLALVMLGAGPADWLPEAGAYDIPEVRHGRYQGEGVGLLPIEREKLATEIAAFVINHHAEGVLAAEPVATTMAERLLSLALNLDPRNRAAMVADFQFRRGVAPDKIEDGYDAPVVANLLVTRARFLREQAGEINAELARFFLAAAMDIDPRNEEAVYQYLLLRREGQEADWNVLTGGGERGGVAGD